MTNLEATLGLSVLAIFGGAYLLELACGRITRGDRPARDMLFTLSGLISHALLSGPVVGSLAGLLVQQLFAGQANALSATPFWLAFPMVFISIEFCHYWIHRWSHDKRWLWKLHRTHHSAEELNTGVLFRYNVFWVLLLPQTWFGAFSVYMGLGLPYMAAILTTFSVNVLTHTSFRWDLWLREKMPWSEPLWRIVERVITLPDTHHAHHAYGKDAHPNGNYAITLFIFDTLFGTARIPNRRQQQFGLPLSKRLAWSEELFWPVIRRPLLPKSGQASHGE